MCRFRNEWRVAELLHEMYFPSIFKAPFSVCQAYVVQFISPVTLTLACIPQYSSGFFFNVEIKGFDQLFFRFEIMEQRACSYPGILCDQ